MFLHFKNFNNHYPRMCNAIVSWNWHSSAIKRFFQSHQCTFFFPSIISPWERAFEGCWLKNWPCGSGEDFFYISSFFSHVYHNYCPLQNDVVHSKTLHPKMLCVKLDWNWPNGYGEKILTGGHINGHQDRRTDKWQTTCDKKSSRKFSAQIS